MRIAQVISRSGCSAGGSIQALLLAKAIGERGHESVFASRGGECAKKAKELGVEHRTLSMRWTPRGVVEFLMFSLRKDVLHAHKGKALSFCILASWITGRVRVFANRGVSFPLSWSNRWKYRSRATRAVVCVSHGIRKELFLREGIEAEKLKVIYGCLPERFLDPVPRREARERLSLPQNALIVSLVGSFRPWKGHTLLAGAVGKIGAELTLLFAGKENPSILERVKGVSGKRVVSLGYREDVELVFAASDVVVNASTEGEGIPGVVREAMAQKKAVVVSDLEGNVELVRHGKTGMVFPAGEKGPLMEAVKRLLFNPKRARLMGANARKVALRFTPEVRAKRAERLYLAG